MQAGARGVKIMIAGRLGGAEMSRSETKIIGSIPLHTLEADVDYGFATSFTTYGTIGVKVWVYRGMFGEEPTEEDQLAERAMTRARRRRESGGARGPRGGGRDRQPQGATPAHSRRPRPAASEAPAKPPEAPAPEAPPAEATSEIQAPEPPPDEAPPAQKESEG